MTEIYELIIEFIKTYPDRFWIGLISTLLCLTTLVIILFKRKRRRKKEELNRLMVIEAERKKAEKIAIENRIKEEIARNYKKKIEEEQKKETSKSVKKVVPENSDKQTELSKVNEPEAIYKSEPKEIEKPKEVITSQPKVKSTEKLPDAIKEESKETTGNLFVNYQINIAESFDNYAVIRIPKKGCIVRTHRFGNTKRRGFKEESFQKSIEKYFGNHFIISGEVRLNTGKDTRPFEPDIAIIDKKKDKNIRIDVEIDEPYAAITRQPTHCKGEDVMRDTYFVDRGWIVIRFSEFQIHTQELECLKYLAFVIRSIDSNYAFSNDLNSRINLKTEKLWDIVQAQKWEKAKYREQYLEHEFGVIPETIETVERDFSEQEILEEKLVTPSIIGVEDKNKNIGYNKVNAHPRDKRISFYPENHIYTIDNTPVPSASTIISKFFPEFDSDYWARRKAIEKLESLGIELTEINIQKEADNIARGWKEKGEQAANEGTFLHEQIECYYLKQNYQRTSEFHLFEQFVDSHSSIEPYRTEWRIFDEDFNIAGTIDLIAKNSHGFEIYDWKRSKKVVGINGLPITENRFQCGVGNLQNIPDTSYNRYCLQQSLYRYILEKKYNLEISRMFLIVLYPEYDRYYKVETPYWKERIEYILKTL